MHNHLTIKANGKPLSLPPEDFSLDIDLQNPMFNDEDSFSYPVEIPLEGNRHLVKNIENKKSPLRPVSFEDTAAKIYVEGFPFFEGKLKTQDDEEVTDSIAFNVDGSSTLSTLIEDLDCVDIPVKDKICIGEKIGQIDIKVHATQHFYLEIDPGLRYRMRGYDLTGSYGVDLTQSFTPQALGFSVPKKCRGAIYNDAEQESVVTSDSPDGYSYIKPKITVSEGGETYINVSEPYPNKQYCNARVAYKHFDIDSNGETTDSTVKGNPYYVLDADRPQSGICFYVQYFLDCLFSYLGVQWDNSALLAIEDFNRLCFYTTKCKYDEEEVDSRTVSGSFDSLNQWLRSRGCGAEIALNLSTEDEELTTFITSSGMEFCLGDNTTPVGHFTQATTFTKDETITFPYYDEIGYLDQFIGSDQRIGDKTYECYVQSLHAWFSDISITELSYKMCRMYANSENFPDMTVSELIESLENQFGIRFLYQPEENKVTAVLLRDMFRSTDTPREFLGTIHEMNKVSEKITGVRVCYSEESDSKEQRNNLRDNTKDYDTNYDYIDYPSPDTKKAMGQVQACTTVTDKTFSDICNKATCTDNTCYIDKNTGNAYRVKVNSEAEDQSELKPAWFEVGQFKGVEIGDCSAANDDYVEEFASSFQPLILSDTNADSVRAVAGTSAASLQQNQPLLCAFCDEEMEHEFVKQYLDYPFDNVYGTATCRVTLRLSENYDVTGTEDGNSPLQTYDWGNAIAIMRGGGSDASLQRYDTNYDGFGSAKWRTVAGTYALTTDSVDHLGNHYDYNGTEEGLSRGERFSLKIRAYKQPDWASGPICNPDEYSATDGWYYIAHRGTFDRFMSEYANFILNRRKFIVRCECSPAFLADIPNHWRERWRINGEVGYINKVSTSISCDTGIEEVEIEFYAL